MAAGSRQETAAPVNRNFRVLIIGGGIAGCSALYHLTKEGWTDAALLERDELTSGTTWHSAAQVTNFGTTQTMVGLKSHSIRLYRELAADAEFPVGYHFADGGMRLAGNRDQIDGYHHFASLAKGMGVEFEVIDAVECARRHPLITIDGLAGGLWDPSDGAIDPSQLCHALARRAAPALKSFAGPKSPDCLSVQTTAGWRTPRRAAGSTVSSSSMRAATGPMRSPP